MQNTFRRRKRSFQSLLSSSSSRRRRRLGGASGSVSGDEDDGDNTWRNVYEALDDNSIQEAAANYDQDYIVEAYGPIEEWDTSHVTNMSQLFDGDQTFNRDISNWDVSNVVDMSNMFSNAKTFNQPIGKWDVSNVKYFNSMFLNAVAFNQDISSWKVSEEAEKGNMFNGATSFSFLPQVQQKWGMEEEKLPPLIEPKFEMHEVLDEITSFMYRHMIEKVPSKAANINIVKDYQRQMLEMMTCDTGCRCLVMTVYEDPSMHIYLNSLRYPAPSNCLFTGKECLEAVVACSKYLGLPVRLQDAASKMTKHGQIFSVANVSIVKHGQSWYERFGFFPVDEDPVWTKRHKRLNEQFRKMKLRDLLSMSEDDLAQFMNERKPRRDNLFVQDLLAHVDTARKRLTPKWLDYTFENLYRSANYWAKSSIGEQSAINSIVNVVLLYNPNRIYYPREDLWSDEEET